MRFLVLLLPLAILAPARGGPLRVFILAGQSNMEGHAKVGTLDYLGDDPATAPLLALMRGADGRPTVCSRVWISYLTGPDDAVGEGTGRLTAGFGARRRPDEDGGKIGPEFTFGLTLESALSDPILLIKTAWGGKSLFHDFRPPGAGVYRRSAQDVAKGRYPEAESGRSYRLMIGHVRRVLADPARVCPAYDPRDGVILGGFIWLQGWNDLVNRDVYPVPPPGAAAPRFAEYSRLLGQLIRDVRRDLSAPELPFVIGVLGVGGREPNEHVAAFRPAMRAPAAWPEFAGTVAAVETAPFWDERLGAIEAKRERVRELERRLRNRSPGGPNAGGAMDERAQREFLRTFEAGLISADEQALWERGASNAGYHYLGCGKTFALMGRAFAEAALALAPSGTSPRPRVSN